MAPKRQPAAATTVAQTETKKPDTYVPELTAASEAAKLLRETVAL